MSNRMTLVASEVRVNDHIYNGPAINAHPTNAWETISEAVVEDGLIHLFTGDKRGILHGEFWFEPEEEVVVIRYPVAAA